MPSTSNPYSNQIKGKGKQKEKVVEKRVEGTGTAAEARARYNTNNKDYRKPRPDAGVKPKTLWNSWMALSPTTRMRMGLAAGVFSILGVLAADKLEASYPPKSRPIPVPSSSGSEPPIPVLAKEPGESTQSQSRPRLFGISVVDREK